MLGGFLWINMLFHYSYWKRLWHWYQENRALKVIGGIKGIANSEITLNECFLKAAEMGNIVNKFCKTFGIDENQSRKSDEHVQLTGSKNARIETNCAKLSHVFSEHDVTFEGQDSVYNIFTKKVLATDVADRFLQAKEIGRQSMKNSSQTNVKEKDLPWTQ